MCDKLPSIKQFFASRAYMPDLGIGLDRADLAGIGGFTYSGGITVEDTATWSGKKTRPSGRWYLCLDRSEYNEYDLTVIERVLLPWAVMEGFIDGSDCFLIVRKQPGKDYGLYWSNTIGWVDNKLLANVYSDDDMTDTELAPGDAWLPFDAEVHAGAREANGGVEGKKAEDDENVQITEKIDGQLEIDWRRGVLYFHSEATGCTALRICGFHKQNIGSMNLANSVGDGAEVIIKSGVFTKGMQMADIGKDRE